MIVLGITSGHNAAAALMADGRIVGMLQEERLTRRKNQVGFPRRAIEALVDQHLGGDFARIDRVAQSDEELVPLWIGLDHFAGFEVADWIEEMHAYWRPYFYGDRDSVAGYWEKLLADGRYANPDHNYDLSFLTEMPLEEGLAHFNTVERRAVLERLFGWTGPTDFVNHHKCHGYYALHGGPLDPAKRANALVLTADADGDGSNWSAALAEADGTLRPLAHGADQHVARLYKFVTLILGMKPNEHEYKIMGLSAYSRSRRHIEAAERVFIEAFDFRDGAFVRDRPLVDSYFDLKDRLEGHRFDNVAAALQNWADRVTCAWAGHWLAATGRRTLCFSGGLSLNIKTNGRLLELPGLDWLSVPASGGDESLAAGACFAVQAERFGPPEAMKHVYLGGQPEAPGQWRRRVTAAGGQAGGFAMREGIGAREAACLLAADCILARCVGPGEFGARSLGNRSILANPANRDNVKLINDAIKARDFWMPFTPSILAEHAGAYIDNPKGVTSPFMTIGYASRPEHREELIGGLHAGDLSARPQFVDRATNPDYWAIIDEFRKLTGIAALVNTSLNLHGEPMNYSLDDAVRTVVLSELDFLLMPGGRLLYKKRASARLEAALDRAEAAA